MNKYIKAYQEKARADQAYKYLRNLKKRIESLMNSIPEIKEPKFTGWFVLLKKNNESTSGFEFLCIFNPDTSMREPEWDMAIPIQTIETINEFTGW